MFEKLSFTWRSCLMTKQTKWHVRPAKTWISLGIRSAWSESSLCAELVAEELFFMRTAKILNRLGGCGSCMLNSADSLHVQTLNAESCRTIWAAPSEFVSSSIPSWQTLTAHVQPFRGARDLVFCLKVPLDSLLVWASSGGSGETARMRRLAWTFAARIGDKYQIRLARPI